MASLTIRKLDEGVKTYLRLRSARNRRSVEEEVRVILGELIRGPRGAADAVCAAAGPIYRPHAATDRRPSRGQRHPDHRRWHRGL
ncbi:plasmid stability protein [Bradyrhizobium sp. i1.4.4]